MREPVRKVEDRYLGVDQSYTGFAMVAIEIDGDGNEIDRLESVKAFPKSKHGEGVERLLTIEDHIKDFVGQIGWPALTAMEGYAYGARNGREMAGELGYAVKRTLFNVTDACPTIVPPTSLKKFVTGKGTAKKQEMLLAVYKRFGVEYSNDNLADAYSLARMAAEIDSPGDYLTDFQREALKKVTPSE